MTKQSDFAVERAKAALVSRDYSQAEKILTKVIKENPADTESLSLLGTVYLRADRQSNALAVYKKIAELNPKNTEALNNLGVIYRRLGMYQESISVLNQALTSQGDTSTALYNLGSTYKQMGKYDDAADCFITVIDEKPDDVLAYNHLGVIQALRGEHTKAIQAYWKGLQIDPNHPILHFNIARSYEARGKIQEALSSYEAALRSKPGWTDAIEAYADLLVRENRKKEAEDILTQALKIDNSQPHILTDLGRIYAGKNLFEDAKLLYLRALASDEKYLKAISSLEHLYERLGDLDNALFQMEQMDSWYPGNTDILIRYARLLMKLGHFFDSEKKLEEVLKKEPDNIDALRLQGRYFSQNGERKKAQECFNRILEIDPTNIGFRVDIAEQLMSEGDFKGAEQQLRQYLTQRPDDWEGLLALAEVFEALREIKKALECYRRLLQLDKGNPEIMAAVSRLCSTGEEDEEAVKLFNELINSQGGEASGEAFASINDSLSHYEKALEKYEEKNNNLLEKNIKQLKKKLLEEEKAASKNAALPGDTSADLQPLDEEDVNFETEEESVPQEDIDFSMLIMEEEAAETLSGLDSLVRTDSPIDFDGSPDEEFIIEEIGETDLNEKIPEEEELIELQGEPLPAPRGMPPLPRPLPPKQYNPITEEPLPAAPEQEAECTLAQTQPRPRKKAPVEKPDIEELPLVQEKEEQISAPCKKQNTEKQVPVRDAEEEPVLLKEADVPEKEKNAPETVKNENPEKGKNAPKTVKNENTAEAEKTEFMPERIAESLIPEPEKRTELAPEKKPERETPAQALRSEPRATPEQNTPAPSSARNASVPADEEDGYGNLKESGFPGDQELKDMLGLFICLKHLSRYLPDSLRDTFLRSDGRLRLEYIIDRLLGKPGLMDEAEKKGETDTETEMEQVSMESFSGTLSYLRTLAGELPDKTLAAALDTKIDHLISRWDTKEKTKQ